MTEQNTTPRVYYYGDLVAILRQTRQAISRAVKRGDFPQPRSFGRKPYWTEADLEPVLGKRDTAA